MEKVGQLRPPRQINRAVSSRTLRLAMIGLVASLRPCTSPLKRPSSSNRFSAWRRGCHGLDRELIIYPIGPVCALFLFGLLAGCGGGSSSPTRMLISIAITPSTANISRGSTKQFTATATFSNNTTADITSTCSWSSSNTSQVTVSSSGLATAAVTATLNQSASLSCSQNGISAATPASVTVVAAALSSIAVVPVNPSAQVGQTVNFSATGTFTDGTRDLTASVNWTASPAGIVSFAPALPGTEVATALATGTATIMATDPSTSIQGTTTLTVVTLTSINVTDVSGNPTAAITVGSTDQLIATATYSNNTQANITNSVAWVCTPAGIATVDASGLATGVASGTCTVTASESGVTSSTFTLTVNPPQLCSDAAAVPYLGAQAGGGDRFDACIDHRNTSFSFLDRSARAISVTGAFAPNATYSSLLNLNSTTPTTATGTAVEMPSTALLINPGGLKTRTNNALLEPIALVFRQQTGVCPSAGATFWFVTLPQANWTTSNLAYGTIVLGSSSLTISGLSLTGASAGATDNYSCDASTSLLTFTDASLGTRHLAVSPSGLFVGDGANGFAGLPQPAANLTIASGEVFLGVIYEPGPNPGTVTTVGFTATSAALDGFDPLTTGNPSNGITITLGSQSSPGLFTGGTLVEGTTTDADFAVIANTFGGKKVLYGVTFNTVRNTPVGVLLLQQ